MKQNTFNFLSLSSEEKSSRLLLKTTKEYKIIQVDLTEVHVQGSDWVYFLWLLEKKLEILLWVFRGGEEEAEKQNKILNKMESFGHQTHRNLSTFSYSIGLELQQTWLLLNRKIASKLDTTCQRKIWFLWASCGMSLTCPLLLLTQWGHGLTYQSIQHLFVLLLMVRANKHTKPFEKHNSTFWFKTPTLRSQEMCGGIRENILMRRLKFSSLSVNKLTTMVTRLS